MNIALCCHPDIYLLAMCCILAGKHGRCSSWRNPTSGGVTREPTVWNDDRSHLAVTSSHARSDHTLVIFWTDDSYADTCSPHTSIVVLPKAVPPHCLHNTVVSPTVWAKVHIGNSICMAQAQIKHSFKEIAALHLCSGNLTSGVTLELNFPFRVTFGAEFFVQCCSTSVQVKETKPFCISSPIPVDNFSTFFFFFF